MAQHITPAISILTERDKEAMIPVSRHDLGLIGSFGIVSDIHLRNPQDDHTRESLAALAQIPQCDLLFLLGDIFDFFYAGSKFFEKIWQPFFDVLDALRSRGTRLCFVEGNHDYGFEYHAVPSMQSRFFIAGDTTIHARHERLGSLAFLHGDTVMSNRNYLRLRRVTKAYWFQSVARHIPGALQHAAFLRWARVSRAARDHHAFDTERFLRAAETYLTLLEPAPDLLFLGHLHEHLDVRVANTRILCNPDWRRRRTLLLCTENGDLTASHWETDRWLPVQSGN